MNSYTEFLQHSPESRVPTNNRLFMRPLLQPSSPRTTTTTDDHKARRDGLPRDPPRIPLGPTPEMSQETAPRSSSEHLQGTPPWISLRQVLGGGSLQGRGGADTSLDVRPVWSSLGRWGFQMVLHVSTPDVGSIITVWICGHPAHNE